MRMAEVRAFLPHGALFLTFIGLIEIGDRGVRGYYYGAEDDQCIC